MPLWLLAVPGLVGKVLAFLTSPVGIICIIIAAYLIGGVQGYNRGASDEIAKCEAAAAESRRVAADIDRTVADETAKEMAAQRESFAKREAAQQQRIEAYEKELAARPADARCTLDSSDADRLRGAPAGGVRRSGAKPARR